MLMKVKQRKYKNQLKLTATGTWLNLHVVNVNYNIKELKLQG